MSPSNKKKLKKIRSKLDKLDNSLIKIIKKRTNLVKEVLKLKETKKQIVDNVRIKKILSIQVLLKSLTYQVISKVLLLDQENQFCLQKLNQKIKRFLDFLEIQFLQQRVLDFLFTLTYKVY